MFPKQASTMAPQVDLLYLFLIAVGLFFSGAIFIAVAFFAVRYRRRSDDDAPKAIAGNHILEATWIVLPLALVMVMFAWGAVLYFKMSTPPADAMEIFVVGKQWMWKIQHPEGKREINQLHVPVGYPVKLTMTSEDVLHSFFVPAFRMKMDVVPGRYTTAWFNATKIGTYRLFCAEYCGTQHSGMIGKVTVMSPTDYEVWLSGGDASEIPMHVRGEKIFQKLRCDTCHFAGDSQLGPKLHEIFGSTVALEGGRTVVVDDDYIRESILEPTAKVVAGYSPVMPTYEGQINQEQLMEVIAYIRSLTEQESE